MTHYLLQLLLFLVILWQRGCAWGHAAALAAIPAPARALVTGLARRSRATASTLFTGESTSAEWTSAAFSAILAAVLLPSSGTFALSPVYAPLTFMPEPGWGLVFLLHALATAAAWYWNHARGRRIGLLCSTALWAAWLSMLVKDTPQTTGWVYLVPAGASFAGYLRLCNTHPPGKAAGR